MMIIVVSSKNLRLHFMQCKIVMEFMAKGDLKGHLPTLKARYILSVSASLLHHKFVVCTAH